MVWAILLLAAAVGMLAAARFSVWPARSYRAWWVALFATELGYVWCWFALFAAGGAACLAWVESGGAVRVIAGAAAVAALLAAAGFARPVWLAWRMSGEVDARLTKVFGSDSGERVWSWLRLLRWPTSAESVEAESFSIPVPGLSAAPSSASASVSASALAEVDTAASLKLDFYRARPQALRNPSGYKRLGGGQMKEVAQLGGGAGDGGGAPCVVLVHGGGWDGGDRRELAGLNRWLAARGVAVAAFDYRLAPAHPWPAQADDLRVVIDWIRENAAKLGVNPDRLTLVGRSAGGQIATATAYGEPLPGVRAVVALYACHNMDFVWSIRSEHDALNSHKLMTQFLGGGPEGAAQAERYRSASGEQLVHADAPKTLLIHGALDELVWCRHSERLAAELEKAGVPHVFIELPWATHAGEANLHGPSGQLITEAVLRAARGE